MIDYTMKIYGIEEIQAMFRQLPDRIATKVLRKGVAEAGKYAKAQLKMAAPVRSDSKWHRYGKGARYRGPGFLKRHIGSRYYKKKSSKYEKHYGVGPRGYAYYGYILERGFHVVPRGGRKGFRRKKKGAGSGLVSGYTYVPPQPWIVPAFERSAPHIVRNMKDYFSTAIMKEGRRLGFITKAHTKSVPFSVA